MLFSRKIRISGTQSFWVKPISFMLLVAWLLFDSGLVQATALTSEPKGNTQTESKGLMLSDHDSPCSIGHHDTSIPEDSENTDSREDKDDQGGDDWKIFRNTTSANHINPRGSTVFSYTTSVPFRATLKLYTLYHSWKSFLS